MSQDTVTKQASLKEILVKLREANGLFENAEHKLNYLANNSPQEEEKSSGEQSEDATLDALNGIANSLRRKANSIASYTNTIVGS